MSDFQIGLVWFSSTAFLAWSAWAIAGKLFPRDGWIQRLGHCIVIAWAFIVAVSQGLGTLGLLRPTALLLGVIALALGTLILAVRRFSHPPSPTHIPWLWTIVWICVFGYWAGHVVLNGLLRLPTNWDTLAYHLPFVDSWLAAASLYAPDCPRWSDPANNELLALWLVAPFSGDFLSSLNNVPSVILLVCGAVELSRLVGIPTSVGHLCALALVFNMVILTQLVDCENDVAVAALFVMGLSYALRYAVEGAMGGLLLTAACLGLLAGIKFYAIGYAGILLISAWMAAIWWKRPVKSVFVLFVGILLLGGYWYARNWVEGSGPLHPLGGPASLRATLYPESLWHSTLLGNGSPEIPYLLGKSVAVAGGPCYLASLVAAPLTLLWILGSGILRHRQERCPIGTARVALGVTTIGCGLVWVITPFAVEDDPGTLNQLYWHYCPVRYGLTFLTLIVISLAVVLGDLHRFLCRFGQGRSESKLEISGTAPTVTGRGRIARYLALSRVVFVVCVGGVILQICQADRSGWSFKSDSRLVAANLVALVLLSLVTGAVVHGAKKFILMMILVAGVIGTGFAAEELSNRWHRKFTKQYDLMMGGGVFAYIQDHLKEGDTICVIDQLPYPWFGSQRQFEMCQPIGIRSYPQFRAFLDARGVNLVVARYDRLARWREWYSYDPWLKNHPEVFRRVGDVHWRYDVYIYNPASIPD